MTKDEELKNQKIAQYFCDNQIMCHVSLNNDQFWNGYIREVSSDFFIIEDREEGGKVIFYSELKHPIVEFQENVK